VFPQNAECACTGGLRCQQQINPAHLSSSSFSFQGILENVDKEKYGVTLMPIITYGEAIM